MVLIRILKWILEIPQHRKVQVEEMESWWGCWKLIREVEVVVFSGKDVGIKFEKKG